MVSRRDEEIQQELSSQVRLMTKAAHEFDKGDLDEVKNLLRALRVLCTKDQHGNASLIELAGKGEHLFYDTRLIGHPKSIAPELSLVVAVLGPISVGPKAPLDTVPEMRQAPFREWLQQTVIDDRQGLQFTRERLIKSVANLDGAMHYPPEVRAFFEKLKGLSFTAKRGNQDVESSLYGLDKHAVRQIAHEILVSLDEKYARPIQVENGATIYLTHTPQWPTLRIRSQGNHHARHYKPHIPRRRQGPRISRKPALGR